MTTTFTHDDVDALAHKLTSLEQFFSDDERALLAAILVRGLDAYEAEAEPVDDGDDVEGFLLLPAIQAAREAARRSSCAGTTTVNAGTLLATGTPPPEPLSLTFVRLWS